MKEIGGYFGIEQFNESNKYHKNVLEFNYARNCLEYLILKRNIKEIFLPVYLCKSVSEKCKTLGCKVNYYSIKGDFLPDLETIPEEAFLYLVNYYGFLNQEKVKKMKSKFTRMIVDNAQAFFQEQVQGIDTIYSYRKYFGVPDGACLATDLEEPVLEREEVREYIAYMIGRNEKNASMFYQDFQQNEIKIKNRKMKKISYFSENILRVVDFENVKKRRTENFEYLQQCLGRRNELTIKEKLEGPYMYPLLIKDSAKIKQRLISHNIYIPTLWPSIEENRLHEIERKYINQLLPLPIDQRYTKEDMEWMVKIIKEEKNV